MFSNGNWWCFLLTIKRVIYMSGCLRMPVMYVVVAKMMKTRGGCTEKGARGKQKIAGSVNFPLDSASVCSDLLTHITHCTVCIAGPQLLDALKSPSPNSFNYIQWVGGCLLQTSKQFFKLNDIFTIAYAVKINTNLYQTLRSSNL